MEASGTAKVFNFLSNLGALISFLLGHKVIFSLGIPLALANIAGNYVGSHLAVKKGTKVVRAFLLRFPFDPIRFFAMAVFHKTSLTGMDSA